MLVLIGVVDHSFLLDRFLRDGSRNVSRRRGERADFQRVEGLARVSIASDREELQRVGIDLELLNAQTALLVGQGALQQLLDVGGSERLKQENLRAGDEGRVDVEERVVRGRPVPSSTSGNSTSCCALLKRWISSMKRIVR